MGFVSSGGLATLATAKSSAIWEIPKEWSMEEAATVPVVYGTVVCALFVVSRFSLF